MTEFDDGVCGLGQLLANVADAKILIGVAEGHLRKLSDILLEMKTKAEQAASDTLAADERAAILAEIRETNTQIVMQVSEALRYLVTMLNRLGHKEASLNIAEVNTEATYNPIMNADMAHEQLEATKRVILEHTAIALLAQANVGLQAVLAFFQ